MSRILGFVLGAALVFAGLLYLLTPTGAGLAKSGLGLPAPPPGSADATAVHKQAAAAQQPTQRPPIRQATSQPEPEAERESGPEPGPVRLARQAPATAPPPTGSSSTDEQTQSTATAVTPPGSAADRIDEQALVESALAAMQDSLTAPAPRESVAPVSDTAAGPGPDALAAPEQTQWFAVWDPFHSELSANAFARRLERLTGLDYRVVRSGPAKYEVAVAFASEPERVANIALIEEETGLRIAGGDLE